MPLARLGNQPGNGEMVTNDGFISPSYTSGAVNRAAKQFKTQANKPAINYSAIVETREENPVAVRLRLMRMGKKKQPTYRVVAADSRSPRDGRFIEIVGTYNPRSEPSLIKIDNAKAVKWLREGAQPSDRVKKLLDVSGAWSAFESGTSVEELEALAAQEREAAAEAAQAVAVGAES